MNLPLILNLSPTFNMIPAGNIAFHAVILHGRFSADSSKHSNSRHSITGFLPSLGFRIGAADGTNFAISALSPTLVTSNSSSNSCVFSRSTTIR
ncbi:MAG: hypothetical protein IJJ28_06055 [Lentisphaeria bacterium]|nr:hypothetical protein [Lentisphaeria bacterium]